MVHLRFTKASIRLSSSSSSSSSTSARCFVGGFSFGVGFITFGIGARLALALVAGAVRLPLPFGSSEAGAAISSSSPMTLPLTDAFAGALPVSLAPWCWTLRLLCAKSFSVTARSSAVSRFSFSNSWAVRKEKGGAAENLQLESEKGFGDASSS